MISLSPTISAVGITAPTYQEILDQLKSQVRTIYGQDIYLDDDSQDGQFLAIFAQSIKNNNDSIIASYNSFSPMTAQGAGLASVVKINGLAKLVATNSTATVSCVGQTGTTINSGQVADNAGNRFALPTTVVIPDAGTIDVTATCTTPGAVAVEAGALSNIVTPTRGWQSVTNALAAVPGAPVEDDATLRQRQSVSVSQPAQTPFDSICAEVANVPGVIRSTGYENDTNTTDANTIPPHSISMVVEGGDVDAVGEAISLKKAPGTGTYGTTNVTVIDPRGISKVINFYGLALIPIYYEIDITPLAGFAGTTATLIQQAVAAWTSGLAIGGDVYQSKVYSPANLYGDAAVAATGLSQTQLDALSNTYKITSIKLGTAPSPGGTGDITINFNQAASGVIANVNVVT